MLDGGCGVGEREYVVVPKVGWPTSGGYILDDTCPYMVQEGVFGTVGRDLDNRRADRSQQGFLEARVWLGGCCLAALLWIVPLSRYLVRGIGRKLDELIIAIALIALGAAAPADWLGFVALDMSDSIQP